MPAPAAGSRGAVGGVSAPPQPGSNLSDRMMRVVPSPSGSAWMLDPSAKCTATTVPIDVRISSTVPEAVAPSPTSAPSHAYGVWVRSWARNEPNEPSMNSRTSCSGEGVGRTRSADVMMHSSIGDGEAVRESGMASPPAGVDCAAAGIVAPSGWAAAAPTHIAMPTSAPDRPARAPRPERRWDGEAEFMRDRALVHPTGPHRARIRARSLPSTSPSWSRSATDSPTKSHAASTNARSTLSTSPSRLKSP